VGEAGDIIRRAREKYGMDAPISRIGEEAIKSPSAQRVERRLRGGTIRVAKPSGVEITKKVVEPPQPEPPPSTAELLAREGVRVSGRGIKPGDIQVTTIREAPVTTQARLQAEILTARQKAEEQSLRIAQETAAKFGGRAEYTPQGELVIDLKGERTIMGEGYEVSAPSDTPIRVEPSLAREETERTTEAAVTKRARERYVSEAIQDIVPKEFYEKAKETYDERIITPSDGGVVKFVSAVTGSSPQVIKVVKDFPSTIRTGVKAEGGVGSYAWKVTEPARTYGGMIVRGGLKQVYAPNIFGGPLPLIDIGQEKLLRTEGPLILDPDVQAFNVAGGLVALSAVSPVAAGVINYARVAGGGIYASKFLKSGKPEDLGTSLMLLTPEIVGGVKRIKRLVVDRSLYEKVVTLKPRKGGVLEETFFSKLKRDVGLSFVRKPVPQQTGLMIVQRPPKPSMDNLLGNLALIRKGVIKLQKPLPPPHPQIVSPPVITRIIESPYTGERTEIKTTEKAYRKLLKKRAERQPQTMENLFINLKTIRRGVIKLQKPLPPPRVQKVKTAPVFIKRIIESPYTGERTEIKTTEEAYRKLLKKRAERQPQTMENLFINLKTIRRGVIKLQKPLPKPRPQTVIKDPELIRRVIVSPYTNDWRVITTTKPEYFKLLRKRAERQPQSVDRLTSTFKDYRVALKRLRLKNPELIRKFAARNNEPVIIIKRAPKPITKPSKPITKPSKPFTEVTSKTGLSQIVILEPPKTKRITMLQQYKRPLLKQKQIVLTQTKKRLLLKQEQATLTKSESQAVNKQQATTSTMTSRYRTKVLTQQLKKRLLLTGLPRLLEAVKPATATATSIKQQLLQRQTQKTAQLLITKTGQVSKVTEKALTQTPTVALSTRESLKIKEPKQKVTPKKMLLTELTTKLRDQKVKTREELIATERARQAYNILVKIKQLKKKKGQYKSRGYKKANKQPLTKEAAIGLGMELTDRYTNQSFKISQTRGKPESNPRLERLSRLLNYKFRRQKKNNKIFVERTRHAIDSPQEVRGIPYEAARQRRAGLLKTTNNFLTNKKQSKGFLL